MRQSVSVIKNFDFSFNDMKELRESNRRQLFYRFEKNVSLNKSLFSSKQLIIKSSFEN